MGVVGGTYALSRCYTSLLARCSNCPLFHLPASCPAHNTQQQNSIDLLSNQVIHWKSFTFDCTIKAQKLTPYQCCTKSFVSFDQHKSFMFLRCRLRLNHIEECCIRRTVDVRINHQPFAICADFYSGALIITLIFSSRKKHRTNICHMLLFLSP